MSEFKSYHPIVNFIYFLAVLSFSMIFMHPLLLMISLAAGFVYSIMLSGKRAVRANLYTLPFALAVAILNPVFNHQGMTIIAYLPSGNPLTMESVSYGIAAGVMLMSILCYFSCFNEIMTSDKLMCLIGRIIPSLSLVFSMVLRFVPKFKNQIRQVRNAQFCVGKDFSQGGILKRTKNGIKIISVMTTWCLENGVDTADSMKSRGFGQPHRTAYSNFALTGRDICALVYVLALSVYIIAGGIAGTMRFDYFPAIYKKEVTPYSVSVFAAYLLLFVFPIIIEIREGLRWQRLKSKI